MISSFLENHKNDITEECDLISGLLSKYSFDKIDAFRKVVLTQYFAELSYEKIQTILDQHNKYSKHDEYLDDIRDYIHSLQDFDTKDIASQTEAAAKFAYQLGFSQDSKYFHDIFLILAEFPLNEMTQKCQRLLNNIESIRSLNLTGYKYYYFMRKFIYNDNEQYFDMVSRYGHFYLKPSLNDEEFRIAMYKIEKYSSFLERELMEEALEQIHKSFDFVPPELQIEYFSAMMNFICNYPEQKIENYIEKIKQFSKNIFSEPDMMHSEIRVFMLNNPEDIIFLRQSLAPLFQSMDNNSIYYDKDNFVDLFLNEETKKLIIEDKEELGKRIELLMNFLPTIEKWNLENREIQYIFSALKDVDSETLSFMMQNWDIFLEILQTNQQRLLFIKGFSFLKKDEIQL